MARREAQQPQEPWKQYDLNGDGKIARQEFMAVRGVCFARYDAADTGMLTQAEVRKVLGSRMASPGDGAFSRVDLDGDGLISREEFARENDRLFRQMDTNGDGVIAGTELTNVNPVLLGDLCPGTFEGRPRLPERR
jgi:Ca2+-binding EF-hand superfamily protein